MSISDATVISPITVQSQSFFSQIILLSKSYSQLASQETFSKVIFIFSFKKERPKIKKGKKKKKGRKNPKEIRTGDLKAIFILIQTHIIRF